MDEANSSGRDLSEIDPEGAAKADDGEQEGSRGGARESEPRRETPVREDREEAPTDEEKTPAGQQRRRREIPTEDDKPAGEEKEPAPKGRRLKYRGKQLDVSDDELVGLAQQGLDYNERMRQVGDERKKLDADREGLEAFGQYREWLREHPNAAKAIAGIVTHVDEKGTLPAINLEQEDPESDPSDRIPAWARSLMEKVDRMENRGQTFDLAQRLSDAVESEPILRRISEASLRRSKGKTDLALQKLHDALRADPDANLKTLARTVATELSEVAETLGVSTEYVRNKERDTERFRHAERPDDTPPEPREQERPKLTGADLKNGGVRRAAKAWMDKVFA